jgi:hypothetical protein
MMRSLLALGQVDDDVEPPDDLMMMMHPHASF